MKFCLTDLGIVCALGNNPGDILKNAVNGSISGMIQIADAVPNHTIVFGAVQGDVPPADRRCNSLLQMAYLQIEKTIQRLKNEYPLDRIGIVLGTSNASVEEAQPHLEQWIKNDTYPNDYQYNYLHMGPVADYLKNLSGITGPTYTISTACSSSAKSFQSARRLIQCGICDAVIVGGIDSICRFAINGFNGLEALSFSLTNPMSRNRTGINLGEGVALFVMEKDKSGIELKGLGESSDAYHLTAPPADGSGAVSAMQLALNDAQLQPTDIDYINLHGTGTIHNDIAESAAVYTVFGNNVPCASTKPMTGHTLGASGAIEAALCYLMLQNDKLIPHVYDGSFDETLKPIQLLDQGGDAPLRYILSNSFAFGGSNVSLILGKTNV